MPYSIYWESYRLKGNLIKCFVFFSVGSSFVLIASRKRNDWAATLIVIRDWDRVHHIHTHRVKSLHCDSKKRASSFHKKCMHTKIHCSPNTTLTRTLSKNMSQKMWHIPKSRHVTFFGTHDAAAVAATVADTSNFYHFCCWHHHHHQR